MIPIDALRLVVGAPAARLRPAVAAQGDPARERLQGAARRGRDLRARAAEAGRGARRARRDRLVRLHALLQGRLPRGARGRVHRPHLRQRAGNDPARGRSAPPPPSCSSRRGVARARAARPRARERNEVRGRRDADDVRDLLVGRGRGRALAGRRRVVAWACSHSSVSRRSRSCVCCASHGQRSHEARPLPWWDFVVGDDPLVAAGVVLAVAITALVEVWWLLPFAVLVLLYVSLRRASA